MHALKPTRRELLVGLLGCAACGGGTSSGGSKTVGTTDCMSASDGGAQEYCLASRYRVRVPGGALLGVGEAVLLNVDDNTAVILARDAAGLYARSGICTHACCIVALCVDSRCDALTPSPDVCAATKIVQPAVSGGIVCPCHGSIFRLSDGTPVKGPARMPLPSYAAVADGDDAWVDTGVTVDPMVRS